MDDRIDQLVKDPLIADDVARFAAERAEIDKLYAEGLAEIRRAAQLTQAQVAERLDVDQAAVSRIEHREDLLLSTLRAYLLATGGEDPRIVVRRDGVDIVLNLDTFK